MADSLFPAIRQFLPPRIAAALDEILRKKLTIIEAGAGYGKTAFLTRWIESRGIPFLWYPIDQLDSVDLLKSDLTETLAGNSLEAGGKPLLLVLENWHGNIDEVIIQGINSLVSDWPGQIVLCTRVAPVLPVLSRLWSQDEVQKLDESVLAFKTEEISALMVREFDTVLAQEQAEWLQHETEGWPLAIHWAGRTLANNGGNWQPEALTKAWREQVFPYLHSEVLAKLSPEKQEFLFALALPDEISREVFGPLLGQAKFSESIEWAMHSHVFLSKLSADAWRYHRMFHSFLRSTLEKNHKLYQDLNLNIGLYYLNSGSESAAVPYLLRAAAYDKAGMVLEGLVPELLGKNCLEAVEGLLSSVPEQGNRYLPNALLALGEALTDTGRGAEALAWLKRASLGFGQRGDYLAITRSLCATGTAYAALGLMKEADAVYRQAEREELGDDKNREVVMSYINRYRQMVAPAKRNVPKLRLKCLGPFQICRGEDQLPHQRWRRRKALLVLKYLAVHPAHKVQKDRLLDLFWPDEAPEKASNSFYVTMHSLRRELSAGLSQAVDYLEVERGTVALPSTLLAGVDVDEFSFMYQEGRRLWQLNADQALQYFRAAADLYRGSLLDEDPYEEWLFPLRDQLMSQYQDSLVHMARHAAQNEDWELALELWNEVILHESTNESAAREAMGILMRLGRRSEALQFYRRLCDRLKTELDVLPETDTVKLYQTLIKEN